MVACKGSRKGCSSINRALDPYRPIESTDSEEVWRILEIDDENLVGKACFPLCIILRWVRQQRSSASFSWRRMARSKEKNNPKNLLLHHFAEVWVQVHLAELSASPRIVVRLQWKGNRCGTYKQLYEIGALQIRGLQIGKRSLDLAKSLCSYQGVGPWDNHDRAFKDCYSPPRLVLLVDIPLLTCWLGWT